MTIEDKDLDGYLDALVFSYSSNHVLHLLIRIQKWEFFRNFSNIKLSTVMVMRPSKLQEVLIHQYRYLFVKIKVLKLFRVAFFRRDFFQNPYFNNQIVMSEFQIWVFKLDKTWKTLFIQIVKNVGSNDFKELSKTFLSYNDRRRWSFRVLSETNK